MPRKEPCDCGCEDCPMCRTQEEWLSEDGYTAKEERQIAAYEFENY